MGTRYRLYTAIDVTVYIEDGKVTGVDAGQGWHEGSIEAEDDPEALDELADNEDEDPIEYHRLRQLAEQARQGESRDVRGDEASMIYAIPSGRWEVKALD